MPSGRTVKNARHESLARLHPNESRAPVRRAVAICAQVGRFLAAYPELQLAWQTVIEAAAQAAETSQAFARVPQRW
jgi:hypothetical protein